MAARKTRKDTSTMTPEELAAYEERLEKQRAPRPAYIAYTVNEDHTLNIALVTRSAEEVLAAVDADRDLKYQRFLVK